LKRKSGIRFYTNDNEKGVVMKQKSIFSLILVPLSVVVILTSCKTQKSIVKAPVREQGPEFLVEQMNLNKFNFDWMEAKVNITFRDNKQESSISGQVRMKCDSIIWVTLSPALGIEASRLLLRQDSVKYINRLDKTFFTGEFSFLNQLLNTSIDFDMLQSFLIGNDFKFYDTTSFRASIDNSDYKLSTTSRRRTMKGVQTELDDKVVLVQNIWLDPETFKIKRMNVKEYGKDNKNLEAVFEYSKDDQGILKPSVIEYIITGEKNYYVKVEFERYRLEGPLSFPFTIPIKYERLY
jgi:hypothetical protein